MHAKGGGFDLHAGLLVPRADRKRLERVSRYLLRPALALERLHEVGEDGYEWVLKRPWADGTHALRFSGHELMEKLAVLVPMPRANLVRYHGVLAPAARWRGVGAWLGLLTFRPGVGARIGQCREEGPRPPDFRRSPLARTSAFRVPSSESRSCSQ